MADPSPPVRVWTTGATASVTGELGRQQAPLLFDALAHVAGTRIAVDLSRVTHIDEDGVAALVTAQRLLLERSQSFTIRNPSSAVLHQLAVRGLLDFLDVDTDGSRPTPEPITRLVGVYDIDGAITGRLRIWARGQFGRSRCPLRGITHRAIRERSEWTSMRATLGAPFDTCHRNDQPDAIRSATGGVAPLVVAQTPDSVVPLLGPTELVACDGSPAALVAAIAAQLDARDLCWPAQ